MDTRGEVLVRRFASAELRAEVADQQIRSRRFVAPRGVSPGEIFAMTILGSGRSERFQMSPGAEENRVEVPNVDKNGRQLILMVHEPVRTFTEQVMKGRAT